jgi:hypothetical protein
MTLKARQRKAEEILRYVCDADKRAKFAGAVMRAREITVGDAIALHKAGHAFNAKPAGRTAPSGHAGKEHA